ncbi:MAG: Stp1/IreP family PP2C-type Ser/Thr phosphatase [Acidobacteria bacterium]|jgi:protein phosphatase|nr:Stp1/IreP family PP2C-type Ser/Thr phosphatase [Acidobacteriota bacterium]
MNIHFFAKSDIGKVRSANEDFFLNEKIADNEYLFIVADGMGGHQAGDVASKLASETFFDAYRGQRKKGTAIPASMEQSVRKANSVVFRKAAADIEKRGMGTTFSAVVISGMKAYIAHVGDSRIYLVRKNRIKRITTDHSFVEKLVEEGRISPDEARDHPQKNVLYMSLGARESFTPEIMNDIVLEDGDALVMCSDGLSNMVDDETIRNITMGDYPQEAADALVRLANAHGGSDNITVQVIRLGSLEMLEKTKPIRLSRPRRKLIKGIAAMLLLVLLAVLAYVFFAANGSRAAARNGITRPARPVAKKRAPRISEIDSSRLNGLGVVAADCRFLSGRKLHVVQGRRLFVFHLDSPEMVSIVLGAGEQVVPSRDGGIYVLRREPTQELGYQLVERGTNRTLLQIRHDGQVISKESRPGSVSLYKIAGLQGSITPDYIDENIFVFHDRQRYFKIKNWQTPDSMPVLVKGLAVTAGSRLGFKSGPEGMTMLYSDADSGRAALFRVGNVVEKISEFPLSRLPQPLLLEYAGGQALLCYYPDQCLEMEGDLQLASHHYFFNNFQLRIVKVLVDMADGLKLIVNDGNKFFTLTCDP